MRPFGFMCGCGKMFQGRPAYYRLMAHRALGGSLCGPTNRTTNQLPGKGRGRLK